MGYDCPAGAGEGASVGHHVGDIVTFDTGSPEMTVTAVDGDFVTCVWSYPDGGGEPPIYGRRQEVFPGDRLVTVAAA
jgi:uncharacterized protein YodC (DUF2158 family)